MHKIAGLLFFLAGVVVVMGIITAEIFYPPGYSISLNMISNLGSTPPPLGIVHEPSARIFDTSLILSGVMIIIAGVLLQGFVKSKIFITTNIIMGIGVLGVGVFPAYHVIAHPITALIAFAVGGITAILSFKYTTSPLKFVSVILGSIALIFLFLGVMLPETVVPILGRGGTERWVAYPILLWLIAFGGYLMGKDFKKIK